MKRILVFIMILSLCVPSISFADNEVEVVLPSFPITINDFIIDNAAADYPFINYKGITYLPMTWQNAKSLGLDIEWSNDTGLTINSGGSHYPLTEQGMGSNDLSKSVKATLPTFPISINGNVIDNESEDYPLLSYKSITYFPMTWRFMVTEFKTGYKWNDETGLLLSVTPPEPEVPTYDEADDVTFVGNFLVDVEFSSEDETVTLDLEDFPFDFYDEVGHIMGGGTRGTEYEKLLGEIGYAMFLDRPEYMDLQNIKQYIFVDHVFDHSNYADQISAHSFYDKSGDVIGYMLFQKLNEGNNKVEFLRKNDEALKDEKAEYDAWKQEQLDNSKEIFDKDILVVKNRYHNDYSVFYPMLEADSYFIGYGEYTGDKPITPQEASISRFWKRILQDYKLVTYNSFYLPFMGDEENRIYDRTGQGNATSAYFIDIELNGDLKYYLDTSDLDIKNAITEHEDIYYLTLTLPSISEDEVETFEKAFQLKLSYDDFSITSGKYQSFRYDGAYVGGMRSESTDNPDGSKHLEYVLGPLLLEDLSLFEYKIINDGGYELKVEFEQ